MKKIISTLTLSALILPIAAFASSITLAPKWMALPQEGYDVEDNTNGLLAKTGGYPGGITAPTTLGTATFKAKKTGTATIAGTADSLILDAGNKNTVAGSQGSVQVTIAAAPAAPAPASVPAVTETDGTTAGEEAVTTTATEAEAAPRSEERRGGK